MKSSDFLCQQFNILVVTIFFYPYTSYKHNIDEVIGKENIEMPCKGICFPLIYILVAKVEESLF